MMMSRLSRSLLTSLCVIGVAAMPMGCTDSFYKLISGNASEKEAFATALVLMSYKTVNERANAVAANDPAEALQILISEPNGAGSVPGSGLISVFEKPGREWTTDQTIFIPNGANRDGFGDSLSSSETDVIVGASRSSSFAGRAFVFAQSGDTFIQQGTLQAADAAAADYFGFAVAVDGNIALVSAPFEDLNEGNEGAVYAFARSGSTWTQTQKFRTAIPVGNDSFGLAVLLKGTEALISSIDDEGNPAFGGRVHTWNLVAGVWTEGPILKPSDPSYAKGFGKAMAWQDNWLIVGAQNDSQVASDAGAVYVFERVGNSWVQRQKLVANDGKSGDWFGGSVAIDGNYVVVGATRADGNATDSGAAYVFELDGTWNFAGKLIAKEGQAGDSFGSSCAIAGDQVVVGAPETVVNGIDSAGAAYVFTIPDYFTQTNRLLTQARRIAFGRAR
jgi:hypothetical protein